jgi:hypothetical protein
VGCNLATKLPPMSWIDEMICRWLCDGEIPLRLEVWDEQEKKFAFIPCDAKQRLAVCALRGWCRSVVGGVEGLWQLGEAMSTNEVCNALDEARAFLEKPVMVVFSENPQRDEWRLRCKGAHIEEMTVLDWERAKASGLYDQRPFGEALAKKVAAQLRRGRALTYWHRDYCGQGLRFAADHYELADVWDGDDFHALLRWSSEEAFVRALAAMSDFSCSGADPSAGPLAAVSGWGVANQRITRERLEAFVND